MREISETKVWFLYSLTILLHPSYTDQEKKKKRGYILLISEMNEETSLQDLQTVLKDEFVI